MTTTWSKYDGPGTVTFANASAVDTAAAFSAAGTYHLMLRASDSDATTTDMVTVTVRPALTGNVIDVPAEQPTLQAAVQAASSGDTILLAPGTYQGGVWVQGKSLTIASRYLTTDDPAFTGQTVVNGVIANACGGASGCAGDAVIEFGSQAGGSKVIGLTVSGGADGVRSSARVDVSHSRLTGNVDGIDYGNDSGGTMSDDLFDHNTDDGLDLNGRVALAVRNSTVEANEGDGVEFRMYPYIGPTLEVSFVGNRFLGNDTDGIQLIDSDGASSRVVRIERNVFDGNGAASIGCLPNEQTNEDFSGAPLAERVYVTNNTFSGDRYGVVGGANSIVLNNIFTGIPASALRRVGGGSISAHNLFWSNGTDFEESVVDQPTSLFADPLLTSDYTLQPGSPAIDAGTASYQWNGETVLNMPSALLRRQRARPRRLRVRLRGGGTPNQAPVVDAGTDQSITLPQGAALDATVTDDGKPTASRDHHLDPDQRTRHHDLRQPQRRRHHRHLQRRRHLHPAAHRQRHRPHRQRHRPGDRRRPHRRPGPAPSSNASPSAPTTPRSRPPAATPAPAATSSSSTTATTSPSASASRASPSPRAPPSPGPTSSSRPTRRSPRPPP